MARHTESESIQFKLFVIGVMSFINGRFDGTKLWWNWRKFTCEFL